MGVARVFPLADAAGLVEHNVKAEAVEYLGRKAVRITSADSGLAMLPGVDFQDGAIEAEIALKITTPPGVRMPGFVGIGFRSNADGSKYDLFYLRPGNSHAEDQAMRNHSVQYAAEPDFDWYPLRRQWPGVYESYADIAPETWIKVRIEVAGRTAKLFLNGAASPALVVDGLKGSSLHGAVGLWGYAGEEAYFSNVRITPAAPVAVRNGADAAGDWDVRLNTDAGSYQGTMHLTRDGEKIAGTWTGALGAERAIMGTWRDGYVEISFPGEWGKEMGIGAPGATTVTLAGWVDDASAGGRGKVEGRADGRWSAKRKP